MFWMASLGTLLAPLESLPCNPSPLYPGKQDGAKLEGH